MSAAFGPASRLSALCSRMDIEWKWDAIDKQSAEAFLFVLAHEIRMLDHFQSSALVTNPRRTGFR